MPSSPQDESARTESGINGLIFDRLLRAELAVLVFLVVLILFPYVRDPSIDAKILVYTWGGGILTLVTVLRYWRGGTAFRRPSLFHGLLLGLLGLFVISGLFSKHVGNSLEETSRFLALYLIYFLASQAFRKPEHLSPLLIVTCAAVGLSVSYGILQHQGWDPFPWNQNMLQALEEAPGTFGNGNIAAHTTVLCVAMAAYLALSGPRRYWCLLFVMLYLVHLHLSHQRGGIVGVAAAAVLVLLAVVLHRRFKRPRRAIIASLVLLAVLGAGALVAVMGYAKIRTGISYPTSLPILLRYHGYSGASRIILDHPLLGCGPGNFRYENPAYWTPFEQEHFALKHKMNFRAHNDALEIGTETGLGGSGIYLALLLLGIYYGLMMGITDADAARRKAGLFFAAFFCTFLVDGFFGFNLRVPVSGMLLFLIAGAFEGIRSGDGAAVPAMSRTGTLAMRVVLPILAVGLIAFQSAVFASEMLFQRALGAIHYKVYDQADALLAKGESIIPWNWEFAFDRGDMAMRLYKPENAIKHFERALPMNPYYPPLSTSTAHAYLMLGELSGKECSVEERLAYVSKAADYARKALALCPPLAEGEDMMGRYACLRATLLAEKKSPPNEIADAWKEGVEHLRRAVDDKVREADRAYLMLARAEVALDDKAAAQDALVRAAGANPANANVWQSFKQFADATGQRGAFCDVVRGAVAALRRDGKDVPPELEAIAMLRDNDAASARDAMSALARATAGKGDAQPGTPAAAWAVDVILAEPSIERLPDADKALMRYNAGTIFVGGEDWQKATEQFSACWKQLPLKERTDCVMTWTQILTKLKRPDDAIAVLREAEAQTGGNAQLQLALARALAKAGRNPEARVEYEFLLNQFDLDPRDRSMVQQELGAMKPTAR